MGIGVCLYSGNRYSNKIAMVIFIVLLIFVLAVCAGLFWFYWENKLHEHKGTYLQITLPRDDKTPTTGILDVLSLLATKHNLHYSFELLRDEEGLKVLLWVSSEEEKDIKFVENCIISIYKDAACEIVNPNFENEKEAKSVRLSNSYWMQTKGIDKFKDIETLDFFANLMQNTRIQIIAKPEHGWSSKIMKTDTNQQSILSLISQNIFSDMRQTSKVKQPDRAEISSKQEAAEHGGFMCEMRIIAEEESAIEVALNVLSRFNSAKNAFVLHDEHNKEILLKHIEHHDFLRNRVLRDSNKMMLSASCLGAIWHFAGSKATAHDIAFIDARMLPIPKGVPVLKSKWLEENLYKL